MKHTALLLAAHLSIATATAAPVVVAPGSNAGYMYFPGANATTPSVTIPVKTVGEPCVSANLGNLPNQSAAEGQAITADRTSLLTCQSSQWQKPANSTVAPLHLDHQTTPPACPAGWTEVASTTFTYVSGSVYRRTCLPPSASCAVLSLDHQTTPPACPAGWTDAASTTYSHSTNTIYRRSCIKC